MQKSTSSALSEKKGDKKLPNVFGEKQKKKNGGPSLPYQFEALFGVIDVEYINYFAL